MEPGGSPVITVETGTAVRPLPASPTVRGLSVPYSEVGPNSKYQRVSRRCGVTAPWNSIEVGDPDEPMPPRLGAEPGVVKLLVAPTAAPAAFVATIRQ